jgi:hypothetical protein
MRPDKNVGIDFFSSFKDVGRLVRKKVFQRNWRLSILLSLLSLERRPAPFRGFQILKNEEETEKKKTAKTLPKLV